MTDVTRELTCREVSEFIADYVAGQLSPEERALFEEHLIECPDCRDYLRTYADTIRLAKDAYAQEPVPPDMPEPLVRAILRARRRRS